MGSTKENQAVDAAIPQASCREGKDGALIDYTNFNFDTSQIQDDQEYVEGVGFVAIGRAPKTGCRNRKRSRSDYSPHSGVERFGVTINEPDGGTKFETAQFTDQNPAYTYAVDSEPDPTFGQADMDDASLENFFRRPLKIQSYTWNTNSILFESFNPWSDFFDNPRVINRISNFNLLRCKLHVKIVINGVGFHYGRAIASYNPLSEQDNVTVDRAFFTQDIVAASQRPHIYLNPTTSQGGELCLPFVWYRNALNIPLGEWRLMGDMILQSLNQLRHANGAEDPVTVSVFAWAEDVQLSIPTANDPDELTPQSGKAPRAKGNGKGGNQNRGGKQPAGGNDEYTTNGPISRPASVIAKIAGRLTTIPMLAPYAKATELAAGAVAGVAALFGYSRPAVLQDIVPYKPTFFGNVANTNVPDSVQKLSLDCKQEVPVDPRVVGLGSTDEMAIVPLAMRESYLTTFNWGWNRGSESLLWNCEVTPMLWQENFASQPPELHLTPAAMVTMPFKYWRGSMRFRFQVVASQFHKGRLKIVYDPFAGQGNEYNTNYTYIIDIADQKDFTVRIGWGNQLAYCGHDQPGRDDPPYGTFPLGTIPLSRANGVLKVYVVNQLTAPNTADANPDIFVNVFPSMCEDFEVANPTCEHIENYGFFPYPTASTTTDNWPLGLDDLHARQKRLQEEDKESPDSIQERLDKVAARLDLPAPIPDADYTRKDFYIENAETMDPLELKLLYKGNKYDEAYEPHSGTEAASTPSGEGMHGDVEDTSNDAAPMTMNEEVQMGADPIDTPDLDQTTNVYIGEAITSIRQLMKRYVYHDSFTQTETGVRSFKRRYNNIPLFRGFDPDGVHAATSPSGGGIQPYNRVKTTVFNWFFPAFVAWRGAVRWKYIVRYNGDAETQNRTNINMMSIKRIATERGGYEIDSTVLPLAAATQNVAVASIMDNTEHTWDGNTVTYTQGNSALEAELPWYSSLRFFLCKNYNRSTAVGFNYYHWFETITGLDNSGTFVVDAYQSIGEDFSLHFFTGMPIVYYYGRTDPGFS